MFERGDWPEVMSCDFPRAEFSMALAIEVDLPGDLARFRLPETVDARLRALIIGNGNRDRGSRCFAALRFGQGPCCGTNSSSSAGDADPGRVQPAR